ncbi:MAG: efflux RND transporter periplasmic adaptor subunit, partial [Terriglobales bacterium]
SVGTVRAQQVAQLSAQIVASVRKVNVAEGATVRAGEALIVLDSAQQQAGVESANAAIRTAQQEIAAAEADASLAASTLKRYELLQEKRSVSPHEMDEVQARAKAATARRDLAQAQLAQAEAGQAQARTVQGYTVIRAPFDGIVTAKLADPGAMAAPGVPLLVVEDTRKFRLEVTVDEGKIADAKMGESVPVTLDALGDAELQCKVVQIVPAADPGSRSFLVKLELPPDSRIRSGLFGRAVFAHGTRQATVVPSAAVIQRGQLQAVYVVDDKNIADLRYITLGRNLGQKVEVLSGLASGERIVFDPAGRELAGKKVED